MSVLTDIQNELKAPKNRTNKFGGYKYRSCEDILEAVKPILKKYDAMVTIRDDIIEVGNRVYVRATVLFRAGDFYTEVTAFAREAETKKGMDDSQITGTASSYARKYALNGLFLIDDTKDADTDEYQEQIANQMMKSDVSDKKIGEVKGAALVKMLTDDGQDVQAFLDHFHVQEAADLTEEQHRKILDGVRKRGSNRKN